MHQANVHKTGVNDGLKVILLLPTRQPIITLQCGALWETQW